MVEHEVCNQEYDKCPGCGQYKGQYHNGECPYIKDEQHNTDDDEQDSNNQIAIPLIAFKLVKAALIVELISVIPMISTPLYDELLMRL